MWDVKACRSCLTVKGKLEKIEDASKRQYSAITGLQISENDGYPAYFCMECRHHIRKSLAFRRKSRRAHFVLKEIMTVRKQISYSDIVTVNRKKTNLESSLNFWEPNNNSCFLIANEEGKEEEESLKKYNLEEPQTRFHSKHLVEITPDHDTEIPEETNEQQEEFNDDIPTNDYLEPEPDFDTTNIDMNDIFKDLNVSEDNQSDDGDLEDFLPPSAKSANKTVPKKPIEQENKTIAGVTKHYSIPAVADSYLLFDLTVLNTEQQKEKFELMKRIGPFAKALYKCAMCLTIHKDMPDLVQHVQYHNDRKFGVECVVCKNKLPSKLELDAHVAECHLYEYNCKVCRARVYSQFAAVSHVKDDHSRRETSVNFEIFKRRRDRKLALSNFTISALSQQMMNDMMLLRSRPEHKNKKHMKSTEVKPGKVCNFKCDVCDMGFKFHKSLEKHMVLRHRYMYTCKLCKEVFTTRFQALEHNDDTHTKHKCDVCGKVFKKFKKLKSHRQSHTKMTSCNLCGHSSKNEKLYYRHQLMQHGYISINDPLIGDPEYKCGTESCGVQFVNKRSLEVHLVEMNHAGAEDVPYACIPCKKLYENYEELDTHLITCREATKYPRKCCYCTEILHNAMEYKLHYIHVHPTLQYRYLKQNAICDICGKSIFKPLLEQHLRTHAGAGYECRLCSTLNTTPAAHIAHILANHARRPYKCSLCPRRFKVRGDCKDHILRIHAPTKLFKCEFCAAEFSYFRSLKEHAEKLHNLSIPPIKPKVPIRSKTKLHVYAHMKIIINESEKDVVNKLQVELVDYLEQKSKTVDGNDYFIFSPHAEEVSLCMKKKQKKKRKKVTEVEAAVAQITLEWPEPVVKDEVNEVFTSVNAEGTNGNEVVAVVNVDDVKGEDRVGEEGINVNEGVIEMEVDKLEIDGEPLEVVENDGHQFVMIDGEMYRIAAEDDE